MITKGRTFISGETVTPEKLNDLVDDATIDAGGVGATELAAGAVTAAKIAAGAVETAGIGAGAVTAAKIAAGAVETAGIAAGAVTGEKLSGAQSGSAPIFGVRAWVNFDSAGTGAGTPTIHASGNVAAVSRVSTGVFEIELTTPMASVDYGVIGTTSGGAGALIGVTIVISGGVPVLKTTTELRIQVTSTGGVTSNTEQTTVLFIE